MIYELPAPEPKSRSTSTPLGAELFGVNVGDLTALSVTELALIARVVKVVPWNVKLLKPAVLNVVGAVPKNVGGIRSGTSNANV